MGICTSTVPISHISSTKHCLKNQWTVQFWCVVISPIDGGTNCWYLLLYLHFVITLQVSTTVYVPFSKNDHPPWEYDVPGISITLMDRLTCFCILLPMMFRLVISSVGEQNETEQNEQRAYWHYLRFGLSWTTMIMTMAMTMCFCQFVALVALWEPYCRWGCCQRCRCQRIKPWQVVFSKIHRAFSLHLVLPSGVGVGDYFCILHR